MAIAGEAENKHIVIPGLGKKYPRKSLSHRAQGDFVHEFSLQSFLLGQNIGKKKQSNRLKH